jgi:ribonuclease-3
MSVPASASAFIGLRHVFKEPSLLVTALTHPSYAAEAQVTSSQRLEFLGDAVLKLLVAELLYVQFPDWPEGTLTHATHRLVGNAHIADLARQMHLGSALRLGKGASRDGTAGREKVLADCFEALIGAVYEDGGYDAVRAEFGATFKSHIEGLQAPSVDLKSQLQAREQKAGRPMPLYRDAGSSGNDHARLWRMELVLGKRVFGPASASSKAAAEVALATMALLDDDG